MLHQLEGSQPIEEGEGAFADVAFYCLSTPCTGCLLVADSRFDGLAIRSPHRVQVDQSLQRLNRAVGVDAVGALQLQGQVALK